MIQVALVVADWCGACHKVLEKIEASDINLDYLKIAVFEENLELCNQAGVKSIPTVIFLDNSGELLDKLDMDITPDKIKEKYNQLNNN